MKVAAGTFLAGLVGAIAGVVVAIFQGWTGGLFSQLIAGILVGGIPALSIGWCMGMHGGGVGSSDQATPAAPAWGIVTGLVYGLSLGAPFGAIVGFITGKTFELLGWGNFGGVLLLAGGQLGLFLGPIVATLAWEASFFVGMGDRGETAEAH